MRFSFVLAVVATLTASAFASDAAAAKCPLFCKKYSDCNGCKKPACLIHVFASEEMLLSLEQWRSWRRVNLWRLPLPIPLHVSSFLAFGISPFPNIGILLASEC
ncbi:hypothetical protein EDB19DRAFT_1784020, partial [Suillus lakei]